MLIDTALVCRTCLYAPTHTAVSMSTWTSSHYLAYRHVLHTKAVSMSTWTSSHYLAYRHVLHTQQCQ